VRAVNLNCLDPESVDVADFERDPDTFVEPHAGEVLFRLLPGAAAPGEPDGRHPAPEGSDG
jgi:lactate racemase